MRSVVFRQFYRGSDPSHVTFGDGTVSGYLEQRAVKPFPAHRQEVSGWYRDDAFEMRITLMPIGNIQTYQVGAGELVEPR